MDVKKIKDLASNGASGELDIKKAQIGSNGYGFVFFDFNSASVDRVFSSESSNVCGAGTHFNNFERFMNLDELEFSRLSDFTGLDGDIKKDMLLAGSLKSLLPDLKFGGDEVLFDTLMFVMTPDNLFFPATFYYGASGPSLGGWRFEKYQRFPREMHNEFNFSPFGFNKDELILLVEAHTFALRKAPISDFCGIYRHDMGSSLMCVHDGVPFIIELGYRQQYGEYEVELVLKYLGYDFKSDKFNYKRMVKESKEKLY